MEKLLITELVIARLLLKIVLEDLLVHPWNLTEHGQQLEIAVTAQEVHFAHSLSCRLFPEGLDARLFKSHQRAIATRYVAVKSVP